MCKHMPATLCVRRNQEQCARYQRCCREGMISFVKQRMGGWRIGKRFPKEITDEQDVEGGLGSSQGPKEKWTCWLRAEPPAKAVCAQQTSLPGNPSGRPWQGLGGSVVLSCWPRPGFTKCTYVPLQAVTLAPCGRLQFIPLCLILFHLVPAET